MMKYSLFLSFFLLLSSCVTPIKIHKTPSDASIPPDGKKWEETVSSFFFGFVNPVKNIKAWEKCPTNWHTIKIKKSFLHVVTSLLTLGFYTPSKVVIICDTVTEKDEFKQFEQKSSISEH